MSEERRWQILEMCSMYLMYAAYAASVWASLALIFVFQLPGLSNVSGAATTYLIIFPLVAICCSAELLFDSDEVKRDLDRSFADGTLTSRYVVCVGFLAGALAVVAASATLRLAALISDSAVAFWVIAASAMAWFFLCPIVAFSIILARGNRIPPGP